MAENSLTVDQIVQKIDELPTLPTIVYELNKIISDPMSSTSDVENVMSKDQSLTTRVLKLVNSAYYAIPGGVTNLGRAVAYLGFDTVQQLVLSATVIDTLGTTAQSGHFDIGKFWQHSMGVAMASETIAKFTKHQSHADLFTCGLLHDLGKMALFIIDPDQLDEISQYAIDNDMNMEQAERATRLARHCQLGHHLTKKWQLPSKIQIVAQYHHEMDPAKRHGASAEMNEMVDTAILGNLLVHALKFGESGHKKILGAPKPLLERLRIPPGSVKELVAQIRGSLESADAFLKIIGGQ